MREEKVMTSKKGHYGSGSIDKSAQNSWRLRYRIKGVRYTKVIEGSRTEAARDLRHLLHAGDTASHVAPDKMTVEAWIDHWISIGAPGKRKKKVGRRTLEWYEQLLRSHVKPALGKLQLRQLQSSNIDKLYAGLEGKMSETTARHVHTVFNSCLSAAVRKKLLARNPIADAEKIPYVGKFKHDVLDDSDLPKTERGIRTFRIDDSLAQLLAAHREKQKRLVAGLPDSADVDLSLIKLPAGALLFPGGDGTDLTKLRDGRAVSRAFKRRIVKLGFPATLRLHDLRGSHETVLLDAGVAVHVVAERCGHDPAVLLRNYAKRTKKAFAAAADIIGALSAGILGQK
jgi:hypothetical protein